jgi:hypothetical protein
MNAKYEKILSDIKKSEKKKADIDAQIKALQDSKTEYENLEIINTVRALVMDKGEVMAFLSKMKADKTRAAKNTNTGGFTNE